MANEEVQGRNRPYDVTKKVYLRYRQVLVDWMCEVGDTIKVQSLTVHHAVAMMDAYFARIADVERSEQSKKHL